MSEQSESCIHGQAATDEPRYNVGVIGKSGSGKSSFINAYLGIKHRENYAAKTDVVECTTTVKPFWLPGSPVVLWDVPGYNTQAVTFGEDYLKRINFTMYDFYLHISSTKIEETELTIHNAIAEQGKRYFYIRTKIDRDLQGQKRAHPRTYNEENEKKSIKNKVEDYFPEVPVFLVDCMDSEAHDLPNIRLLMEDAIHFSRSCHRKVQGHGSRMAVSHDMLGISRGCILQ